MGIDHVYFLFWMIYFNIFIARSRSSDLVTGGEVVIVIVTGDRFSSSAITALFLKSGHNSLLCQAPL